MINQKSKFTYFLKCYQKHVVLSMKSKNSKVKLLLKYEFYVNLKLLKFSVHRKTMDKYQKLLSNLINKIRNKQCPVEFF